MCLKLVVCCRFVVCGKDLSIRPFSTMFSIIIFLLGKWLKHDCWCLLPELAGKVYPKKQKQVILHVLPLLWHLLGATNSSGSFQGGSSDIRIATGRLVNALYQHMGHALIERASSDANVTPRHIQLLQDLVEQWWPSWQVLLWYLQLWHLFFIKQWACCYRQHSYW